MLTQVWRRVSHPKGTCLQATDSHLVFVAGFENDQELQAIDAEIAQLQRSNTHMEAQMIKLRAQITCMENKIRQNEKENHAMEDTTTNLNQCFGYMKDSMVESLQTVQLPEPPEIIQDENFDSYIAQLRSLCLENYSSENSALFSTVKQALAGVKVVWQEPGARSCDEETMDYASEPDVLLPEHEPASQPPDDCLGGFQKDNLEDPLWYRGRFGGCDDPFYQGSVRPMKTWSDYYMSTTCTLWTNRWQHMLIAPPVFYRWWHDSSGAFVAIPFILITPRALRNRNIRKKTLHFHKKSPSEEPWNALVQEGQTYTLRYI